MRDYRYILEPYKGIRSRHKCPSCDYQHKFSRYIDLATGEHLDDNVGRCDRENSCGYHLTPKMFFNDHNNQRTTHRSWPRPERKTRFTDFLPFDIFDKSVSQYEKCNLYPFFVKIFGNYVANKLCTEYFIGANKDGNTVFWQVAITGEIRQAKVMQYNSITGRRNRDTGALFAGKTILGTADANFRQCFFGEYQLSLPENVGKRIGIVESEKTVAICKVYYPDFVWLATGGKNGCKWTEREVCGVLAGREVVLFPDLGAYDKWKDKGKLLAAVAGCRVVVSDYLEKKAEERDLKCGLDIADYLLRIQDSSGLALTDHKYPVIWDFKNY